MIKKLSRDIEDTKIDPTQTSKMNIIKRLKTTVGGIFGRHQRRKDSELEGIVIKTEKEKILKNQCRASVSCGKNSNDIIRMHISRDEERVGTSEKYLKI